MRPYRLDLFEDDDGDKPCLCWIKELTPAKRHAIGVAMEQVLQSQGLSVCEEKAATPMAIIESCSCTATTRERTRRADASNGRLRLRGSACGNGIHARRNGELDSLWVKAHNLLSEEQTI